MRTLVIVVGNPNRDLRAGVVEVEEQRLIEKLVAHATVDGVDGPCTRHQRGIVAVVAVKLKKEPSHADQCRRDVAP